MYQKSSPKGAQFTFRSFSRKGYSLFAALGSEVKIGVLAVATLGTAAPCLAASSKAQHVAHVSDQEQVATLDDDQRLSEVVTTASRTPLAADQAARKVMTLSRAELAAAGVTNLEAINPFADKELLILTGAGAVPRTDADILRRYLTEVTPTKKSARNESLRLSAFCVIFSASLANWLRN